MNKQILLIIMCIFLIEVVFAIYPGESTQIDLSHELDLYLNYTILRNTSAINISIENLIATIIIPTDYITGNFSILFNGIKESKEKEVIYVYSGGCLTTYKCSEWGECINGIQTRDCQKEKNYCYAVKVNTTQNCIINEPIENKTIDIKINEKPKDNTFLYILLSVFILFLIIFIIMLIRYYYIKKKIIKKVKI